MRTARRTFVATGTVAVLAAAGVTAAIAADPAPAPPPRIAFLANGITPADALAAGPIAGQLGAPMYTTQPDTLSSAAATGLGDYDPELVIVLGGPVAIHDTVISQVENATGLNYTDDVTPAGGIVRAAGGDRFDTAAAVADLLAAYNPAYLPINMQAIDADKLDGKDSTDFLAADGKAQSAGHADTAGDADTLDGDDATDFLSAELVDLLPIAVVNVASNGSLQSSKHRAPVTSTPDSTRLSTGRYLIDLPGAHYHYADDSVACTALSTSARPIGTNSASSDLLVEVFDDNGNNVDDRFSCAVYDLR